MMPVRVRKRKLGIVLTVLLFLGITVLLFKSRSTHEQHRKDASVLAKSPSLLKAVPALQLPKLMPNITGRVYTVEGMLSQAALLNFRQTVRNKDKFGDHRAEDPIIVVQTHDRHTFLKLLLDSLRTVKGIEAATLIISRDKFTEEMDKVIDNEIDFCRYIEIFFPYSMQLYPRSFPGDDPNDCPRDLSKAEARRRACNNAECPDMYGHYREVKFVQLKHHWFWKLNMVFNGIHEVNKNTGPVLMLEDDNYVVPDLIEVMKKMDSTRKSLCPDCLAITLGAYDVTTDYKQFGAHADVTPWVSSKHNIGMVLNQDFYEQISACAEHFCKYDDYNWDWSLQSTALKCISAHLHTVVTKVPRVYHLGCTGFHQKQGGRCDVETEVKRLTSMIDTAEGLFPSKIEILSTKKGPNPGHPENGGWGDVRDQELCRKYASLAGDYLNLDLS